ncbi:MAG: NIPSNAP family protein [Luteimonas sp.]
MTNSTLTRATMPIVELRQYTLQPGQRDVLIDLFERHLIEPQHAAGMQVLAHFRDLDAADRFVWFRGFASMDARASSLPRFYIDGDAWKTHRDAANATMIDSDNVLLLREARPGSGFAAATAPRPRIDAPATSTARVVVTTYAFAAAVDDAFLDFFDATMAPQIAATGARLLATYASADSANNFPRLPVREGEHVFVWVAAFDGDAAVARHAAFVRSSLYWRDAVEARLSQWLIAPAEVRRLMPAARSLVQGGAQTP